MSKRFDPPAPEPDSGDSQTAVQQRLIEALSRPTCYPHPVARVRRIETHISTVLLAGQYVYKIKKPVRFPFVDYSTLAQRQLYCEEELRLNRRFAPELYLDCVAIRGPAENPTLVGNGPVIEYSVKMRRFPEKAQGDFCARQGTLTVQSMADLAETIARYHAGATRRPPEEDFGTAAAIAGAARANLDELRALVDVAARPALDTLADWTGLRIATLEPIMEERRATDRVRECHGDLHLANLIYRHGRWTAFDCVEFDARLRWIDVMDDIAFTLMDLTAHSLSDLAPVLLNRYLEITGDYAGLEVLRFYLVYRALVRAKVFSLAAQSSPCSLTYERAQSRQACYLATATELSAAAPRLIITHGVSGSGKTRAAGWVAEHFGYIHIRSDVERKRLHQLPAEARTHSKLGYGMYGHEDTMATYARLFDCAEAALSGGWRVILDATFLDREQRAAARNLADRLGVAFYTLALDILPETARQRIRARGETDASEADLAVLDAQLATYRPLAGDEKDVTWVTSGDRQQLNALFRALEAHATVAEKAQRH